MTNVPKGYKVDFGDINSIEIVVSGTEEQMANFELAQGSVSLSLSGIKTAGTYELPLDIVLDSGMTLEQTVSVTVNVVKATAE